MLKSYFDLRQIFIRPQRNGEEREKVKWWWVFFVKNILGRPQKPFQHCSIRVNASTFADITFYHDF